MQILACRLLCCTADAHSLVCNFRMRSVVQVEDQVAEEERNGASWLSGFWE